ncbi:hypothetical protein BDZ89DRAFT_1077166 [Hymenopellis radicata]|nr:hypothetical protein BDZ89DRAFT_1077166 [Hymenopellis radicata]
MQGGYSPHTPLLRDVSFNEAPTGRRTTFNNTGQAAGAANILLSDINDNEHGICSTTNPSTQIIHHHPIVTVHVAPVLYRLHIIRAQTKRGDVLWRAKGLQDMQSKSPTSSPFYLGVLLCDLPCTIKPAFPTSPLATWPRLTFAPDTLSLLF